MTVMHPDVLDEFDDARALKLVETLLGNRIDALEDRVHRLEAVVDRFGELKFCGVWQQLQQYERGNLCVLDGGMWHCEMRTRSRPGTDASWRLAIKSGTFSR
jgi:hypothetical protein